MILTISKYALQVAIKKTDRQNQEYWQLFVVFLSNENSSTHEYWINNNIEE